MIKKCWAKFWSNFSEIQERTSGNMIGDAREQGGLYLFIDKKSRRDQDMSTDEKTLTISNNDVIMLWFKSNL